MSRFVSIGISLRGGEYGLVAIHLDFMSSTPWKILKFERGDASLGTICNAIAGIEVTGCDFALHSDDSALVNGLTKRLDTPGCAIRFKSLDEDSNAKLPKTFNPQLLQSHTLIALTEGLIDYSGSNINWLSLRTELSSIEFSQQNEISRATPTAAALIYALGVPATLWIEADFYDHAWMKM